MTTQVSIRYMWLAAARVQQKVLLPEGVCICQPLAIFSSQCHKEKRVCQHQDQERSNESRHIKRIHILSTVSSKIFLGKVANKSLYQLAASATSITRVSADTAGYTAYVICMAEANNQKYIAARPGTRHT